MKTTPARLEFACPISWETMAGTDAVRDCSKCGHLVHNLSSMTGQERAALFSRALTERVCIGYYLRSDGNMVTPDAPLTPAERTCAKQFGLAALSVAAMGLAAGCVSQPLAKITEQASPAETEEVVMLDPTTIRADDTDEAIVFLVGMICEPEPHKRHGPAGK